MKTEDIAVLKELIDEDPEGVLEIMLTKPFWPPSINPLQSETRFEDYSPTGSIAVTCTPDGDGHIMIVQKQDPDEGGMSQRFATHGGGGQSERVRKALLFLYLAIKWDNRDHPQHRVVAP